MFFKKVLAFTFLVYSVTATDSSILCSKDFCDNYPGTGDIPCPKLPSLCDKTKSDSGIFLPSPVPCNCCDFCIGYLGEGDSCTTGEKTSDSPTEICGPGLFCDQENEKCRPMVETICTKAQVQYDQDKAQGKTGDYQIRPICDGSGDYVPYHCTPGGICYCVDKNGNRIFGSIDNNGKAEFDLPCSCSRNYNEMSLVIGRDLHPGEYFRCAQNGAYESLQCIDDHTCLCVDALDGAPTFKDVAPVEIWAISNTTLPCFNSTTDSTGKFYRRCEEVFINKTREVLERKTDYDLVLSYELPSCSMDGNYAPVQENHKYKFCSTPDGIPIEGYILEKNFETKKLRDTMNCKCAMAIRIMTSLEKPSCLKNGNYDSTQCRRGTCYTVDEDGNQVMN